MKYIQNYLTCWIFNYAQTKTPKRANYTGSVYKLSGRRRKPWAARISKGYDKDGKRIREIIGCYETKTEAMKALSLYDITPTERPNIKLCEVYEEWAENKFPKISKSMQEGYRAAYLKLQPLHNQKFRNLRTAHLQNIIDIYSKTHSRSSLNHIKALLGQLYKYANMNDIILQNYAKFIELPSDRGNTRDSFTDFEKQILFDNDHIHIVKCILLMMYMGYRLSVSLSLTIFDYNNEYDVFFGGNKTKAGKNRPMPVPNRVRKYLDYFFSINGETVICQENGKRYTPRIFRDHYYIVLKELGIETENRHLPPHCLKHTYSTMLDRANVKDNTRASLCGHTSVQFTDKVYTHKQMSDLRAAVDDL